MVEGPFEESWSNTSLISVDDDWSDVPGMVGYRGDGLSVTSDEDLRTIVADGSTTPVDVNANQDDPDTFAEGGVTEFDGIPDPTIALKGSETADVPHLVLSLDTTGMTNVEISYNAKCLSGSGSLTSACTSGTSAQQVNTQARLGGALLHNGLGTSGDYTNLDGGYIADASGPDQVTPVTVELPAWANDQPLVEVRIMTGNASGENAFIGIDDIQVTSTIAPPVGTVAVSVPSDLTGQTGSAITVPISVSDVSGLGVVSFDYTVAFDPAVMTPSDVSFDSAGTLSESFTITTNPADAGTLVVSGFGTSELIGSGTLLNLKFDLVGAAPSCSSVDFSAFEFNEGNPPAQTTGGQVCVINGAISGAITYGNALTTTPVPDVLVTASGSPEVTDLTDADGLYQITALGPGPYVVTPSKTGDVNGISAFDAALVAQKVVGVITFTPNQSLAADVSGNGTISSFDAAQIAQYVLEIPNSSVAGTWTFSPESRTYPTTTSPYTNEDYEAILMGEVSGNWAPPTLGLSATKSDRRLEKANPTHVSLPRVYGLPNTIINIPVTVGEELGAEGILSYEVDLTYDPAVLQPDASFADTSSTLSASMAVTVNNSTAGRSRLAAFGTSPLVGQGTLINLRFRVVGTFGQISPLTWNRFVFNEGEPGSITTNGRVTVTSATSVPVRVGGQVLTTDGRGIPKATVTIIDGDGSPRTTLTNGFGYFQFDNVATGQAYTIGVRHKNYQFANQTQVVFVGAEISDLIFTAFPN